MVPLIAALIALAIVMFLWRYLDGSTGTQRPGSRPTPRAPRQRNVRRTPTKPTAPDDDPEFLRELRHRIAKQKPDEASDTSADEK